MCVKNNAQTWLIETLIGMLVVFLLLGAHAREPSFFDPKRAKHLERLEDLAVIWILEGIPDNATIADDFQTAFPNASGRVEIGARRIDIGHPPENAFDKLEIRHVFVGVDGREETLVVKRYERPRTRAHG